MAKKKKAQITRLNPAIEYHIDPSLLSDGHHTMKELYEHRNRLFIALCRIFHQKAWRAKLHDDGTSYEGHFIAGMRLSTGDITYHLPNELWSNFDNSHVVTLSHAPKWDGHTPNDVLHRLYEWCRGEI